MGFDNGFAPQGFMFSVVPIFIGIIFVIVIGTVLVRLLNYGKQKTKPKETVGARIISKRQHVWSRNNNSSMGGSRTSYYATFELECGKRVEYMVPSNQIGILAEGDVGTLTHQGTLFVEFSRMSNYEEC